MTDLKPAAGSVPAQRGLGLSPDPHLDSPGGAPVGRGEYAPRLTNEDLAPLKEQSWSTYNIFAFWMSDVHSVGGYLTAGSLFALGLTSWQVFICLIAGIVLVQFFCNLVAKPSQQAGVPYPVVCRASFGVLGANIPAIIRGLIAVAWYGVQTFLAAESLNIVFLKIWPGLAQWADVGQHGFLGLSYLGYVSFAILWVAQAALFSRGMDAIKRFIDLAGPAVYVTMLLLCAYLLFKADFNIDLNLSDNRLSGWPMVWTMLGAIALVVAYFSGPMLNFGDFARYGRSYSSVKKGNFWGLPINFVVFSLLVVLTAAATVPVYGELITDPIETVNRIDNTFAIILGAITFVTATVGINIVANFISPAFDFSHVNPQKISWKMGGMIAAVGSVLLTPWNWYDNPTAIQYTLGILGALIGPLFGILIADFYLVRKQRILVDELFTLEADGEYHYRKGFNNVAVITVVFSGVVAIASVLVPNWLDAGTWVSNYAWFIGCGLAFVTYLLLAKQSGLTAAVAARAAAFDEAAASGVAVTGPDAGSVAAAAALNTGAVDRDAVTGGVGGAASEG